MSSSEESDCYISPSLTSSTMVMMSSRKQLKKRSKKGRQFVDPSKHVRKKNFSLFIREKKNYPPYYYFTTCILFILISIIDGYNTTMSNKIIRR